MMETLAEVLKGPGVGPGPQRRSGSGTLSDRWSDLRRMRRSDQSAAAVRRSTGATHSESAAAVRRSTGPVGPWSDLKDDVPHLAAVVASTGTNSCRQTLMTHGFDRCHGVPTIRTDPYPHVVIEDALPGGPLRPGWRATLPASYVIGLGRSEAVETFGCPAPPPDPARCGGGEGGGGGGEGSTPSGPDSRPSPRLGPISSDACSTCSKGHWPAIPPSPDANPCDAAGACSTIRRRRRGHAGGRRADRAQHAPVLERPRAACDQATWTRRTASSPASYYLRAEGRRHARRGPGPPPLAYGSRATWRGNEIGADEIEPVATVPYGANRLVLFPNHPHALHGVTPRPPTRHERAYVFITAEVAEDAVLRRILAAVLL